MPQNEIVIDELSGRSLLLQLTANGQPLSTASGFVIDRGNRKYLITNWHVLSGRNSETDQPLSPTAAIPDQIQIVHHARNKLGSWNIKSQPLIDENDEKTWIEHRKGMEIDVAALPLDESFDDIDIYAFNTELANADIVPQPAMPVSIIGFPFGLAASGAWPIWKTGHIATDPDLNYDNRPAFLIDATTRGGMSGSPVVLRSTGGYRNRQGHQIMAGGTVTKFLGIYSGRIHGEAEIGRVWRPEVLEELMAGVNET